MHNRTKERALLKRKLSAGVNIQMPAPRRIGKTWTAGKLADDLRKEDWAVVELDVEGMRTIDESTRKLEKKIEGQSKLKDRFLAHVSTCLDNLLGGKWGTNPVDALSKIDPVEFLETLIEALNDNSFPTVIIIDEIAYFILALAEEDQTSAHGFSYKLRGIQQQFKNVRWLLTGSIGLDTIARRYELEGAFVDFETFVLEPFTKGEASSFLLDEKIQELFNHKFTASEKVLDQMFDELGWLAPYYLKLIANEVRPSISKSDSGPDEATREDFEAAFEKLLQPSPKSDFAVWREHIRKNLTRTDSDMAMQLLHKLCEQTSGETIETLLASLPKPDRRSIKDTLDILVTDGLLVKNSGRFAFRSGLVRRYWQEYEA